MMVKKQRIPAKANHAVPSTRPISKQNQSNAIRSPKPMKKRTAAKRPNMAGPAMQQSAKTALPSQTVKLKPQTKTGGSYKSAYDKGYDDGFNEGYAKGLEDGALDS